MKNVKRPAKPKSLTNNASKWKKQLLEEIEKHGGNASKVDKKLFDKYNKSDVKETLASMYDELCCYCEGKVAIVEYGHIEHRKPKRKFPESTYDWNNLHLSCTRCNTSKGNKYSKRYPILDAVEDVPIEEHLTYTIDEDGVWPTSVTQRGETTVDHADLHRDPYRRKLNQLCVHVTNLIRQIKTSPTYDMNAKMMKKLLKYRCKGEHGSLIAYLMLIWFAD